MKLSNLLEATDHLSNIVSGTFDKEAIKREWGKANGIHSQKALDAIEKMSQLHHAALPELIPADLTTVMAGEKVVSKSQFLKLVSDFRKTLNDAKRKNETNDETGTRLIKTITSEDELNSIKADVKAWNKEKKLDKVKLQVFNRPPNKEHPAPYFKVYIDGSPNALKKFK